MSVRTTFRWCAAALLALISLAFAALPPASATPVYFHQAPGAPSVSLIGDSTLAGVRVNQTYGDMPAAYNFVLDAEVCRRTIGPSCHIGSTPAPDNVVDTMARLSGQLGSALVIMGGYNDPGKSFSQGVDAVVAAARAQGVGHVVWLTLRGAEVSDPGPDFVPTSSGFQDNNKVLLSKLYHYPGYLVVVDWATFSAGHPEWVSADGLHLHPAGSTAVMNLIKANLDALSTRLPPARTTEPRMNRPRARPSIAGLPNAF